MMVGSGPHRAESVGPPWEDYSLDPEKDRDQEGSVHTTHTSRSRSRSESRLPYEENAKAMQKEIEHLKKKLCRERRTRTPSFSDPSSEGSRDGSYRPRSRTPSDESFSYEEDNMHERKGKNSLNRGLENDAIGRALYQISKSPFTCRVEEGKLPRHFTQPAFTIYNG